jgi:hypothetical protein
MISRSELAGSFGFAKFSTPGKAASVAARLGISGFHSHRVNGSKLYQPGPNHQKLNKALKENGFGTMPIPGSGSDGMMGSSGSDAGDQGMMMGTQDDDMMEMPDMEADMEMPDMGVEPAEPIEMSLSEAPEAGTDMGMPEMDIEMPDIEPPGMTSSHNSSHYDDDDDEEKGGI